MSFGATLVFTAIMLLAGVGIPIMAALSGNLGRQTGSGPAAVTFILGVAFVCALAATVATGAPQRERLLSIEPMYLVGGLLLCFYAISITLIGPRFGMGNAIFCVLAGQIVCAALIDHFGLFGQTVVRIDPTRLGGIALMIAGLVLVRR